MSFNDWARKKKQTATSESTGSKVATNTAAPATDKSKPRDDTHPSFAAWARKKNGVSISREDRDERDARIRQNYEARPEPVRVPGRFELGMRSVGTGLQGSLPSAYETGKAVYQNRWQNMTMPDHEKETMHRLEDAVVGKNRELMTARLRDQNFAAKRMTEDLNTRFPMKQENPAALREDLNALQSEIERHTIKTRVDPNSYGQRKLRESRLYREEALDGLTPVGRFFAETGLGLAQNAPALGLSFLNAPAGLALMGGQAAGQRMYELNEQGVSPESSLRRGLASGGVEVLTERIPLNNLLGIVKAGGGKSWLKTVGKQMGIEATEEGASYALNKAADVVAQDPTASWSWMELLNQAAQGGISGGVIGTVAKGVNAIRGSDAKENTPSFQENAPKENTPIIQSRNEIPYEITANAQNVQTLKQNPTSHADAPKETGTITEDGTEILTRAAQDMADGKPLTNRTASSILENPSALKTLEQNAGLSITYDMTQSRRRAAVKSAVETLANSNVAIPSAVATNLQSTAALNSARTTAQQVYDTKRIKQAGTALGEKGARALSASYDGTISADGFYAGFSSYYEAGVSGMDMGKVRNKYSNLLNTAQQYAAYVAGQNDASASLSAEKNGTSFATVYGNEAGFIPSAHSVKLPKQTAALFHSIAKATGVKIQMSEATGTQGANGWFRNGIIYIAEDAQNPGEIVAAHEITHRLQEIAPEEYRAYRDYAVNAQAVTVGGSASLVEAYKLHHAKSGVNLTTEQAMDEIAADFTKGMVRDADLFKALAAKNQTVAQKLLSAIRDFIQKVKTALRGNKEAQNALSMEQYGVPIATLEQAAALWNEALKATTQRTEMTAQEQDNKNHTDDTDIRRSLKGSGNIAHEMLSLAKENAMLRERVDYWRDQTRRTKRVTTDKKSVQRAARELITNYGADVEAVEVSRRLQSLYDYLASGVDGAHQLTYEEARRRAEEIASLLVENAVAVDNESYRQYSDLRAYLHSTKLTISETDSHDIADYAAFRKRNFGRIKLGSGKTNIDQVYQEMSSMWPEFFDEQREMHPADQLVHISEVMDEIYDITEYNPFSLYMDQAVTGAANEVMELFFDLPQTRKTFADRQALKLDSRKSNDRARLDALREENNQRMAQLREQNRRKVLDAVSKERERRNAQVEKLKANYAEKDSAGRERRSARELRGKIVRHAKTLSGKLLRPSDKQHIPEKLRKATAAVLEAINLESAYTVDPNTGKHVKDGIATKRTEAFRLLRTAYADITKDGDYTLVIDPDLMENLNELEAHDTPLMKMDTGQLDVVWQTIKAVEASISTANKLLGAARFETISQFADGIKGDNLLRRDRHNLREPLGALDKLVNLNMLTPQAYFHRLGKTAEELFSMLRRAQDRHITIMHEAELATHEIMGKADVKKLERELHNFSDIGDGGLTMSTAQIMALFELLKRKQAQEHIFVGGIRPEAVSRKNSLIEERRSAPVHVSTEECAQIVAVLTEEQKKIADGLQKYMGRELAELGNTASLEVYGYRKFTEPDYFPISVDKNQTKKDIAKDAQAQTIAGLGHTKQLTPHANNAVMLGSIFDVYAAHVNDMATYAAWLSTMENVRRIRDFTFRDEDGGRIGDVKTIIERVLGKNGNPYLNKLVDDINQGIRTNETGNLTDGLVGNYKAAAVALNIRVILQQPTAILRALDTLDAKYLLKGTVKRGDWKKVMKYAPIARWKDWGYFDINTGRQMKNVLLNCDTTLEKFRQAGMSIAGKADSFAWSRLWNAVEAETRDKQAGLNPGTDAFYAAVAQRFSEIVDRTQVVDGLLQRSQIMRFPDTLTKMSTSFMAEPTKTYNMFVNAAYDVRHAQGKDARSNAKRHLARTTVALVTSFAVNAVAQSLVDAMRDDDKEKYYWEKFFTAYTGFSGDEETFLDYWNSFWSGNLEANLNLLGYLPFIKDGLSILQGYDVTRMDTEAIEKVWSAAENMKKGLNGEGKHTVLGASANLFAEAARLLGIPVANIKRDVLAVVVTTAIQTDNYLLQYRIDKAMKNLNYQGNSKTFMDVLYNAHLHDQEAYELIYSDMVKSGTDEEKIRNAMESRMKRDQGAESVEKLQARYLTPSQERNYSNIHSSVSKTSIWDAASQAQRDGLDADLYNLTVENDAGQKLRGKIDGGSPYGISETDYLLYRLAQDVTSDDGNSSTSQAEAEAAIALLTGISDDAKAYLWQSTNKAWKPEGNPYG